MRGLPHDSRRFGPKWATSHAAWTALVQTVLSRWTTQTPGEVDRAGACRSIGGEGP